MQSLKTEDLPENPRENANIFSSLCFWYTLPAFFKGRKKTLNTKDLYRVLEEHKSELLGNQMCDAWEEELRRKDGSKKKPSLLMATVRVFGWQFAILGFVLFFLEMGLRSLQPLLLLQLILYYSNTTQARSMEAQGGGQGDHGEQDSHVSMPYAGDDVRSAYLYAAGVIVCCALNVVIMHPYMLGTMHLGMKLRVAMCSMIYRKSLRLSKNALNETTAGQVVNLLSNDVARFDLSVIFIHYLWIGPLETLLITFLMYNVIHLAAVFGVAFMLLFIPLHGWLGKKTAKLRFRTALRTDKRVRMMNEIIQGIQVIKMYAWEIPFGKMVAYARRKEINTILQVSYIRGILLSFIMFLSRVSIFLSLVGYVILEKFLSPEKAFVITAYYNILRTTMTVFFPQGISQLAETLVSIQRVESYMMHEETQMLKKSVDESVVANYPERAFETNGKRETSILEYDVSEKLINSIAERGLSPGGENAKLSEAGIIIRNVQAKWNKETAEYTLFDVNLRVQPGTMVAIIGPVGSGKSSLIQSILGELTPECGQITVNGTISYVSQEPWLFAGTVRQNILFGAPMDRRRYNAVIKKCALERDLELLPFGDRTIVGERGTSLSGGQKARVSLARAVYRRTAIYLLDDPLSAVDAHVARHLFDQCMRGFLRDHIVILVTHQLQFLQHTDQIVIMDKGHVIAVGSYESLRETGLNFGQLLSDFNEENVEYRARSRSLRRQNSELSITSRADSFLEEDEEENEEMAEGKIGFNLYKKYFKAAGGFMKVTIMLLLCVITQVLASGGDYFLSYWVSKKAIDETYAASNNASFADSSYIGDVLNQWNVTIDGDMLDIYVFTVITVATIIITLYRSYLFFKVAMNASINLHNSMFKSITRGTMHFFCTNASGRILNRFSKDMGQVDEFLPMVMIDVIQVFLSLIGIVIVIAAVNSLYLLPTVILAVLFYYLREFYLKSSRNIKRLEAKTRSPVYSHMAASLGGLSTIRAFGAQSILMSEFDQHQDMHSSAFYLFTCMSRAFGYWLDGLCVVFIAIVTLGFFIFTPKNGGDVGLAITQAMAMTGMVQWGMRQSAELENTMTAVERVVEYDNIEPEGELESEVEKKPPPAWPSRGEIAFRDLSLRYFPDRKAEPVLKSLNFEIRSQEKIGIVGRTGAGKSSLINALFRLSYTDGRVIIDGLDINEIGLHDLRSKISIIPQEPVLFSGTMRYNLDPFDEYTDAKLWESLDEVKLREAVQELPSGLQSKISEGGSNFSVGQRQLVCLARAILRENKILVLDEATANVDPQTDALIQTTIRSKFKNCTVLTIAHRLHTVMDSDKVLVMDAGRVMEYGLAYDLIADGGVFSSMLRETGPTTFKHLAKVAEMRFKNTLKEE